MDNTEREKIQLLESIKLQEAALSAPIDSSVVNLDSDSDLEEEAVVVPVKVKDDLAAPDNNDNPVIEQDETPLSDDDIQITCESNRPSWADALSANMEYDSVLAQLENEIKTNLAKVIKQLDEVKCKINSNDGAHYNVKGYWLYTFGAPYFKDPTFYPCPHNEDYKSKKRNRELCWSDLPAFHQWTSEHKKILNNAVKEISLKKCREDANFKLAVLRKELDDVKREGNIQRAAVLEERIQSFDVDAEAQSLVNDVIENGEHDWMQISAKYLDGKQSPDGCRSFWYMYIHPKINKAPFTEEEEQMLTQLADKYKYQDWDTIAEELDTNRSGYQCFIVYQNKLNSFMRRSTWDQAEDTKLLQIVEECRIGEFIPWGKVAYHMEGRTKTQCFNRWTYSLNPTIKKGRFTKEEDIMILVGVQMWGEDFQRISSFMKDRTTCQVRDRYKHYLSRPGLGIPWTMDDDDLLLKLADKYGKSWAKIAEHFPTKDRTQVRHRYTCLAKWRIKFPDAPLTDAPSRCFNPQKYKDFQEQWNKAKSILSCETVDEMVKAKNAIVQSIITKRKKNTEPPKRKKVSVVENELVNYFRCSYDIPGGRRKTQLRAGESQKYACELQMLIPLLNASINLPSLEDIMMDQTLSTFDREILKSFHFLKEIEVMKISPPHTPPATESTEVNFGQHFCNTNRLLFSEEESPEHALLNSEASSVIDYYPTHDISSLYIDLPLMNFTKDAVVADRNQDPTFFESQISQSVVEDQGYVSTEQTTKETVMCPPNLTTLVGMRTFLLNRRTLLSWANEEGNEEGNIDPLFLGGQNLEEVKRKFDERMLFLFLWPALMSRYAPSSNSSLFLDDEEEVESDSLPKIRAPTLGLRGAKARVSSSNKNKNPRGNIKGNSTKRGQKRDACFVDPSVPSTSGPPLKKTRKVVQEESDDDPDDPDSM